MSVGAADVAGAAPERIRAVLFDLDGTLFDHDSAVRSALGAWLPGLGVAVDTDLVSRWFDAEEEYGRRWRDGDVTWQEQRRLRLRLRHVLPQQAPQSDEGADQMFAAYLREYERAWTAFDDVSETLDALQRRGLRLAVLTNGSTIQQRAKLRAIGLADRFEFVLTAEEIGIGKPDPRSYIAACDRLGLGAGAVVHVGDVPDLDVTAAERAGVRGVLIDRQSGHRDRRALTRLQDLPARLEIMDSGTPSPWNGGPRTA